MTSGNAGASAVAPALGYIYQFRLGLLESLERARRIPDMVVAFELIDDVSFESSSGTDRLQIKHHTKREASLNDASADIWRTLEIWITEGVAEEGSDVRVYLVTTALTKEGTAASFLEERDSRDTSQANSALTEVARTSMSRKNRSSYEAFLSLTPAERKRLLDRTYVLAGTPTITDIESHLEKSLRWLTAPEHFHAFRERLEGWWLHRCIEQLTSGHPAKITGLEIDGKLHDLRESFHRDNLPIDDDVFDLEGDSSFDDRVFVHQLRLIDIGGKRIASAVREYLRAFAQRSRWTRDDLLNIGELARYERRLHEEWEVRFEAMREKLGESATKEAQMTTAQELYEWVEQEANLPIRPRCHEAFITRGSYHMLADALRVGWHPSFEAMLEAMVEGGISS